ncbi:hypothetical protein VSH64_41785 [Amycolatopsis rhabdoformis]|uniref:Uncharacterized protein n=1 Tax=Amycolatopsis rhabdoformis TaxID=1448059 RepID=A0ABZ1I4Z9_9PSEU|nr:hypothetical protein [Amycolatopsis rhabdoformis]WSE29274.1 hypothetical protein VSH64_41785 [Amycolatopsis rhabdoformis]
MSAGAELRKVLSQRGAPLIADLEELVFRHGYLRVFAATVASLGSVGLLGEVLGLAWLQTTFASIAGGLFVIASAISFAGTHKLRTRVKHSEELLHSYADALAVRTRKPISVQEWKQEVTVEDNGDAFCRRVLVLHEAGDRIPRYLSVNLVYYGTTPLSERGRRLVECKAFHAGPEDVDQRTRANATSIWSTSSNGKPKLDLYIHLGNVVQEGDVVTVEWTWPKYSVDLMTGAEPEAFDVLFTKDVSKFEHRVIFRNVKHDSSFVVRNQGAQGLRRIRQGKDVVVEFSAANPKMSHRMGFIADYSRDD